MGSGNNTDCPEITGELCRDQIRRGQSKIAFHAPFWPPRISDDEPLLRIIIADAHHGVPADGLLIGFRQRSMTRFGDLHTFKTFINGESKNKRITGSETAFKLA